MESLETTIATELAMFSDLEGDAFWAEVDRLVAFGDEWEEHLD